MCSSDLSLIEHEQRARANFDLMTLRRDAPVDVDLADLGVQPNDAEVKRLFDFLEFRALYDRMYEALAVFGSSAPAGVSTAEVLEAEVADVADPAAAAALVLLVLPFVPVPDFWITQLNYIGLFALVRSAAGGWFGRAPIDLLADEEL